MRLYSTLQRERVELPEPPGPIRMYFCGPTVYARAHIGNARPYVLGMWLRSWLRERGYDATLVHNITDVNDKIYDAAPGASARQTELKEDPRDFALWKAHKEGEDTFWDSPWGRGRPGWHIECSAMAEELLGERFEIHGGGLDLVFPHHENELAQSRALGHDFAQIWTHNGMLRFTGEKMSKSLGNVVTIRHAIDTWGRETVLLFFMTAHWSKPIDFSEETMAQAAAQVETLRNKLRYPGETGDGWEELVAALDDDLNTPDALAILHRWRDRDLLVRALGLFGLE